MVEKMGNSLPVTANSPKSDYRTAAVGKPLQRRCNLGMITMNLKAIWEMPVKILIINTYYFTIRGGS